MIDLPEEWRPILEVVVAAPIAWQPAGAIAAALGQDEEETTDLLSVMDEAGWISVWETEPVPLITLSPLAAYHLGVVLIEVGPDETPQWSSTGEQPPPPPLPKNVCRSELHARQDKLLDPGLSPDLLTEDSEWVETHTSRLHGGPGARLEVDDLPLPSLFLGLSLTPWPGPAEVLPGVICPGCNNAPLRPHAYCLACDRWGLDVAFAKLLNRSRAISVKAHGPTLLPPREKSAPSSEPSSESGADAYHERLQAECELASYHARRRAQQQARRGARARAGREGPTVQA